MAQRNTKRKPESESANEPPVEDDILRQLRALARLDIPEEVSEDIALRLKVDDHLRGMDAAVERVRDHQREIGDLRFETRRLLAELQAA